MTIGIAGSVGRRHRVVSVDDGRGRRRFAAAGRFPYRRDPNWVPPLPGEQRETFDARRNPSLQAVALKRWVLLEGHTPVGRIAAFAPAHRPAIGYFGFFETPDDPDACRRLLDAAEEWLQTQGRHECYGPIAVTPRDQIGLLTEGFDRPPMLLTPYNPPYYRALLERAGWVPHLHLCAYGWTRDFVDSRGVGQLAERASKRSSVTIRCIRMDQLEQETHTIAALINETLADAWHFDPIGAREAADMARLLRPILDPAIALVADDEHGPCGVALAIPDINWLWRRAGGALWPLGWARLLRWRRRIPQARVMALGLATRVRATGLAARLMSRLLRAGTGGGYLEGELSQIYERNLRMDRVLSRMRLPVVRRYAVFSREIEG